MNLDLARPLAFYLPPTRDHLTVLYRGLEIRNKKGGNEPRLWVKFYEVEENRELEFPLCYFDGTFMEIVPAQKPFEQLQLFS